MTITSLKTIIGDYDLFLTILFRHLKEKGFNITTKYQSDHICYRVSSSEIYHEKKEKLLSVSTLLAETIVNGRPICTFKLNEPIQFKHVENDGNEVVREIPLIELPFPKPSKPQLDGLEHMEVVIDQDFQSFMDQHPGNTWVLTALDKPLNADVEVEFELTHQDKLDIGHPESKMSDRRTFSVKFHHQSLEKVVEIEKALENKQ
eukprot:gene2089-2576_t